MLQIDGMSACVLGRAAKKTTGRYGGEIIELRRGEIETRNTTLPVMYSMEELGLGVQGFQKRTGVDRAKIDLLWERESWERTKAVDHAGRGSSCEITKPVSREYHRSANPIVTSRSLMFVT